MENSVISKQLNDLYNELSKSLGISGRVTFLGGNFEPELKSLIEKVAPCSEIAFVALKNTFSEFSEKVFRLVGVGGGKVVSIITEPDEFSVDAVSDLFNLPDDVRLIVTFDTELVDKLNYLATIKNIPLCVIPINTFVDGVTEFSAFIKNGDSFDNVPFTAERYVIVDNDIIKKDFVACGYAFIISDLVTFTDYRIFCSAFGKAPFKAAYNTLRSAVTEEFSIFRFAPEKRKAITLKNALIAEIAKSFLTYKSGFIPSYYPFTARKGADAFDTAILRLNISFECLWLYGEIAEYEEDSVATIVDYNKRAERVASLLHISERATAGTLISQRKMEIDTAKGIAVLRKIKDEVLSVRKVKDGIFGTYSSLGGKPLEKELKRSAVFDLIRYSGDTFYGMNGLSVLREGGFLEKLGE